MENIRAKFMIIEDWRHAGYVEHKLVDVLIIVMCAVLCGIDELSGVIMFAQSKRALLQAKFGIDRIPSKPTLSRILSVVDADRVGKIIIEIMRERIDTLGDVIAIDGKAIRATSKAGKPHSALQILTAYATECGVVIGQEAIHEKTNEIPVFQNMLEYLDISGKTVTADAMHCQKDTCAKIIGKQGGYVFGLKENQKTLHDNVALFFSDKINSDEFESFTAMEKNGGRIEKRTCVKATDINWLEQRTEWAGLANVFCVRRQTTAKNSTSDETNYYIASVDASAERLLQIVREHWKIESMHWMLDAVFSEDECRAVSENTHKTLNSFRKLALFTHKQYLSEKMSQSKDRKKPNFKGHMFSCLLNESMFSQLLESL